MIQDIRYCLDAHGERTETPAGSVIIENEKGTIFQNPFSNYCRLFDYSAALNAQEAERWEAIKGEADPAVIHDETFNKD